MPCKRRNNDIRCVLKSVTWEVMQLSWGGVASRSKVGRREGTYVVESDLLVVPARRRRFPGTL
jgi:hypothetical protein